MHKKHKNLLDLKINRLVDNLSVWNHKTAFKAKWMEFADYREYEYGEESKNIDWLASSREWKMIVKLFEEEREMDVYVLALFDWDIDFEFNGVKKRDVVEEIFYLLGLSTIQFQNKLWAIFHDSEKKRIFEAKKSKAHFLNIFSEFEKSNFSGNDINSYLEYFNWLNIKNSLVFLLTSDTNIDEKILKISCVKNDFVVCNTFHSFENNLTGTWIIWLKNSWMKVSIDLDDTEKKNQYKKLRYDKLSSFKDKVFSSKWRYLYFDENTCVFSEFFKFFHTHY